MTQMGLVQVDDVSPVGRRHGVSALYWKAKRAARRPFRPFSAPAVARGAYLEGVRGHDGGKDAADAAEEEDG
jgi:hypothetical protein